MSYCMPPAGLPTGLPRLTYGVRTYWLQLRAPKLPLSCPALYPRSQPGRQRGRGGVTARRQLLRPFGGHPAGAVYSRLFVPRRPRPRMRFAKASGSVAFRNIPSFPGARGLRPEI